MTSRHEEINLHKTSISVSSPSRSRPDSTDFHTTGSSADSNDHSSQPSEYQDDMSRIKVDFVDEEEEELVWDPKLIWTAPVQRLPGPDVHPLLESLLRTVNQDSARGEKALDAASLHPLLPHPSLHELPIRTRSQSPSNQQEEQCPSIENQRSEPVKAGEKTVYSEHVSSYVRRLRIDSPSERFLIGEIWKSRSGDSVTKWRRHQWIID
jgi:hypothetical protein